MHPLLLEPEQVKKRIWKVVSSSKGKVVLSNINSNDSISIHIVEMKVLVFRNNYYYRRQPVRLYYKILYENE